MNSLFAFYGEHVEVIYAIHIVITIFISLISTLYLRKRYICSSKEIDAKDRLREEEVTLNSWLFKKLFQVSLHKNNDRNIFLFVFLFNLPIPFIGYFFTIWVVWYLRNVTYEEKIIHTNVLNLDEFGMSFLKVERIFGEGSMTELINNEYASKSKKLKALSSLAVNISPVNLKILRQTLTSTDDEIRMFGYSVINKAEKALNQKVNQNLEIIEHENKNGEEKDDAKIAIASKELAFLYWEMVYTELSHESLKNNFLNQSILYINQAQEYYDKKIQELTLNDKEMDGIYILSSSLHMLRGRIYSLEKEYESAKLEFTVAQELLPNGETFILPYLAEIYYLTGKYSIVKSLLSEANGLDLNATMSPIVQQWRKTS